MNLKKIDIFIGLVWAIFLFAIWTANSYTDFPSQPLFATGFLLLAGGFVKAFVDSLI